MVIFFNCVRRDTQANGGGGDHQMPSRRHQLQQLVATRRRQQQLSQTNVENGKLLSVLRRSKAGRHGQ